MYTVRTLARLLDAIEDDGTGLDCDAYRLARQDFGHHGMDMPDSLAHYHGVTLGVRWKRRGLPVPATLVPDRLPK